MNRCPAIVLVVALVAVGCSEQAEQTSKVAAVKTLPQASAPQTLPVVPPTKTKEKPTPPPVEPQPKIEPKAEPKDDTQAKVDAAIDKLRDGNDLQKNEALVELALYGRKAKDAEKPICDLVASLAWRAQSKLLDNAIEALKIISPELQKPIYLMCHSRECSDHLDAGLTLKRMGVDARPAMGFLYEHFSRRIRTWGNKSEAEFIRFSDVCAMAKIQPDHDEVIKLTAQYTRQYVFTTDPAVSRATKEIMLDAAISVGKASYDGRDAVLKPIQLALQASKNRKDKIMVDILTEAIKKIEG